MLRALALSVLACVGVLLIIGAALAPTVGDHPHTSAPCELEDTEREVVEDDTPETLEPVVHPVDARPGGFPVQRSVPVEQPGDDGRRPELPPPRAVG